jgi:hypothetical protein
MIIKNAGKTLEIRNRVTTKPVSLYSDDPTDFAYKKYMEVGKTYYLDGREISEEEAKRFLEEVRQKHP